MARRNVEEPSVFSPACPSQNLLRQLTDRWSALILCALSKGAARYCELERHLEGISQKMLTQTLRNLEQYGLVARKVHAVVPPKVEYSLTPAAREVVPHLLALCAWAEKQSRIRKKRANS